MLVGGAEDGLLHRLDRAGLREQAGAVGKKNAIGLFAEQRRIGQWWRTLGFRPSFNGPCAKTRHQVERSDKDRIGRSDLPLQPVG
jgi:hypothetical protein